MASKFSAGGVYITFDGDDKPLNKTLKSIQGNIERKLTGALKKFGTAFAAAFAVKKIASFTKESQKLYKVQEQAEVKLAQLMKNAGKYTKENFNEMKAYAGELQKLSNYGDEFVMPIIADLSKAKLATEQLKEATKATLDIMAAGGEAGMLSRVLEKPLEMSGALHRMGILINKEELKGLTLEQQRSKVLDEVNKKYGGMADKLKDPTKQLSNAIGDLKEVVGKRLDNVWKKLAPQILETVNRVSDKIQPFLDNFQIVLQNMITAAQGFGKLLSPVISHLWNVFQSITEWIARNTSSFDSVKQGGDGSILLDSQNRDDYFNKVLNEFNKLSVGEKAIVQRDIKGLEEYRKSVADEIDKVKTEFERLWDQTGYDDEIWAEEKSLIWRAFIGDDTLTKTEKRVKNTYKGIIKSLDDFVANEIGSDAENPLAQLLFLNGGDLKGIEDLFSDNIGNTIHNIIEKIGSDLEDEPSLTDIIWGEIKDFGNGESNGKEFFGLDKFIESINKSMMEEEDAVTKAKNELTKQMQELIEQGEADGKTLKNGAKQAAENAIEAYSVWNGIDSVTNDFKTLASQTNISVEEYSKSLSELGGKYQELLKKQDEISKKINNEADKLSGKQKEMLEQTIADNNRKLEDLAAAAIEAAENFVEIFFEPLKELETQANNSIGSISGGSVASFYTTNKKAKQDISDYRANADRAFNNARDTISHNSNMTDIEKKAAIEKAAADHASAEATAKRMEADQKAAAETEGLTLALNLASDALNTAADSIASNLEAEGDSERAADVREGAQIVSDSVNNFLQGFAQGGPIMGLVMMIIGWIKELLERMGKYLHSLEAIFVSVSKAFDTVAAIVSPIASALEILLLPLTILTEMMNSFMDLFRPFFELMADIVDTFVKAIVKPFQNVFKPVIDSMNKVFGGLREALGLEAADYSSKYDEIIEECDAILKALDEEKAALQAVKNATNAVAHNVVELQKAVTEDDESEWEKDVTTELYKARLAEIQSQKLYKGTSDQLAEYQKVIKENGDIDIEQAKKMLFQLQHEELDANNFYAGNTEKLKDLLSNLIQYQTDENERAKNVVNIKNDFDENLKKSEAANQELKKFNKEGRYDDIINKVDDFNKKATTWGEEFATENADLIKTGNILLGNIDESEGQNADNTGKVPEINTDVSKVNKSINTLSKTLLAINGQVTADVDKEIDNIDDKIANQQRQKTIAEYRTALENTVKGQYNQHAWNPNEGGVTAQTQALNTILSGIQSIDEDYLLNNYADILARLKSNDSFNTITSGNDWTFWYTDWLGNDIYRLKTWAEAEDENKARVLKSYYKLIYNKAGSFDTGGWTGNIPIDKISGFVHGQEYVVKAPYAADYRPMLEAINEGRGSSIFGNNSALQNVNINIDSTVKANDPLSMINEWNKELRNRNLRLELKKV